MIGTSAGRSKSKPVFSMTSSTLCARMHAGEPALRAAVEVEQAAVGDQRDRAAGADVLSALPPGALMKSTFGTSVRRECSTRNRMTFGTT